LRDDPVVHAIDVGPGELLGHGDDGGALLRGDRANAVAQLTDRLGTGLSNRLDLGLRGAVQDRGLAVADRDRVASQPRNNALVLGGLVDQGNELARQALGGQISQSSHFVFYPLLSLGVTDELRQHRARSISDNVALPETLSRVDGTSRLAGDSEELLDLLGVGKNLFFRVALEKVSKLGGRFARNPHRKSRLQAHVLKTDVLQVGRHSGLLVRELRKLLLELSRDLLTRLVQGLLRLDAVLGGLIVRLRQLLASPLRKGVLILSRRLCTFDLSSLVHSLIGHG